MDAVIMARVSSKEQEEGLSLDAQSARLTEYATRHGMNVVKTFVLTESSVHGKRRGFYSVIKYLKQTTRPTALIADAVDRVQRTFSEIGMLDDLRKKKGIELHFYRENLIINNTATSQDIMRWKFSVLGAHSYVLALSENVKRSINHKLANGEISGHAPFGYRNIRTPAGTGDIIPNPDTAPYVRKMFEIYAQGDRTYKDMAKLMNDWGMRIGRVGRKFDPAKIMLMLCNRFYYGEYERNGKIHKLRYEPIISKELWQRTEAVRLGRSYYTPRERRISTPFRGF